ARDLDPRVSTASERVDDLLSGLEHAREERRVLVHRHRSLAAIPRRDQAQSPALLVDRKEALLVTGPEIAAFGKDPDLQQVHGLGPRGVLLTVRHTGSRRHALDFVRADDRAVSHAVLV